MVNTGDNIAHMDAVAPVVEGFDGLLDVPGVFDLRVQRLTSRPRCAQPVGVPSSRRRPALLTLTPKLPWQDLRAAFERQGGPIDHPRALTVGDTTIASSVSTTLLSYATSMPAAGPHSIR